MKIALLFISLFTFFSSIAQTDRMFFKNLTPELGLSHGDVTCFYQDYEGYMWIGTTNGLNKYDGISFTVYKHHQNNLKSLPDNCIISIYEDSKNNLWIGTATSDGLCRYNRESDNFERILYKDNQNKKLENIVTNLFEDNANKLWVSSSNGVFWFDTENKIFHPCFTDVFGNEIQVNFNKIHQDKNGTLWFISEDRVNGGIIKYNPATNLIDRYNTRHPIFKLKENSVYDFLIDNEDKIWVGTYSNGVEVINERTKTITNYHKEPGNNTSISNNCITSLSHKDGRIFVGTNGGGLNVFDPTKNIFEHYLPSEKEGSILGSSVAKIFTGHDGITWMSCWGKGISIYDRRFEKFTKYTQNSGYPISLVTSFTEDLNGNIWIGSDGGGIICFNHREKKFVRYINDINNPKTLTNNKVLAVQADNKGGLWVGFWQGGINYYKVNGSKLILKKKYSYLDETDPKSNSVFRIYKNRDGDIWVGNFETGAYLFDPETERFKLMFSLTDSTRKLKTNSAIADIFSDYQGDVWLATLGTGLIKLNPKNGKLEHFFHNNEDSTSIISNVINVIFEDSEKRLWFGASGLSLFNRETNTFTNYTSSQGLPDNSILGILEDDHHNLWMSTDNGILKAKITAKNEKLELTYRNYSTQDGLQDKIFNKWAFLRSKTGEMYFGGINGFNVFEPDSIKDNPYIPPVHITDFLLFNKPVTIGAKNSPLKKHISQTNEIELKYDQSVLTFRFIALNYIISEKNQYAYILEGFEKDWNYVGIKREATYTNLNPGKYTFRVKASNNDGIWNEKGTSINLIVLPPWWQTWWFRILAIFVILNSIVIYFNYHTHQLRKQKEQLANTVKERTHQLEDANSKLEENQEEITLQNEELLAQKENLQEINRTLEEQKEEIESQKNELDQYRYNLEQLVNERTVELVSALEKAEESDRLKSAFLANMSHEIRTPMNAIVGFSSLLTEPEISNKNMEMFTSIIRKNSESLLLLIDDILDMSQIQANPLIIPNQPVNVIETIKELFASFQLEAQPKGIELIMDTGSFGDNLICSANPLRLKQVLSNLIVNALKFTEKGFVKFGLFFKTEGFITFYVEDSGIGIPKEVGNTIFERFIKVESTKTKLYGGVGLGLAISYNLVNAMGGDIWYESSLGKGTTFYFTLPYNINEHVKISGLKDKEKAKIPDLSNKQILIVEDEEANYQLLKFLLSKTKAKIAWSLNGLEALEYVKINDIDLILMDLKMPVMDGIEATKLIRQIKPNQLIVAQTAYVNRKEKNEFSKCDFNGYIEKPIILEKLMGIVNEIFKPNADS